MFISLQLCVCEKNQLLLRVQTNLPDLRCVLAELGSCPGCAPGDDGGWSSQYSSGLWQGGGNGSSSQHLSAGLPVYETGQYVEHSLLGGQG